MPEQDRDKTQGPCPTCKGSNVEYYGDRDVAWGRIPCPACSGTDKAAPALSALAQAVVGGGYQDLAKALIHEGFQNLTAGELAVAQRMAGAARELLAHTAEQAKREERERLLRGVDALMIRMVEDALAVQCNPPIDAPSSKPIVAGIKALRNAHGLLQALFAERSEVGAASER